jgi:hypothetical protein
MTHYYIYDQVPNDDDPFPSKLKKEEEDDDPFNRKRLVSDDDDTHVPIKLSPRTSAYMSHTPQVNPVVLTKMRIPYVSSQLPCHCR